MAMITRRIGEGPDSVEVSVSDIYGNPAREFAEMQRFWEACQSLRWCPARRPKGWWWKKWLKKAEGEPK